MLKFTKMHGLGNDYIYLYYPKLPVGELSALAVRLSDRHFGVGADGLICIFPSRIADFRMDMYNADGSRGEMCGNGIRCIGKYVYDKGITAKTDLLIETAAGMRSLKLQLKEGKAVSATVDMGQPVILPRLSLQIQEASYSVYPVSMGNPHIVVYLGDPDLLNLPEIGPAFECHPAFPNRTNTEFVEVESRNVLRMRVWERGSGETLACGTGACAALVASAGLGLTDRAAVVRLRGGELSIRWEETDQHIYMTGPAVTVFEGEI